jgi:hypothetical protein
MQQQQEEQQEQPPQTPAVENDAPSSQSSPQASSTAEAKPRATTEDFLLVLCDLQLATGTAIVIAGLGQLPEISYYHQSLIVSYWQLTLNSFWAATASRESRSLRRSGLGSSSSDERKHAQRRTREQTRSERYKPQEEDKRRRLDKLRTCTILLSVILFITFQIIAIGRENYEWGDYVWDIHEEGRCYRFNDHSAVANSWLWIAGLLFYCTFLVLDLYEPSRVRVRVWQRDVVRWLWKLNQDWKDDSKHLIKVKSTQQTGQIRRRIRPDWLAHICWALTEGLRYICKTCVFLLLNFMAVWAWGSGGYGLQVLVYFAFTIWSSYDVIDMKLMNRPLLIGSESDWKFGQVLPVALLGIIIFAVVDATEEAQEEPGEDT